MAVNEEPTKHRSNTTMIYLFGKEWNKFLNNLIWWG